MWRDPLRLWAPRRDDFAKVGLRLHSETGLRKDAQGPRVDRYRFRCVTCGHECTADYDVQHEHAWDNYSLNGFSALASTGAGSAGCRRCGSQRGALSAHRNIPVVSEHQSGLREAATAEQQAACKRAAPLLDAESDPDSPRTESA